MPWLRGAQAQNCPAQGGDPHFPADLGGMGRERAFECASAHCFRALMLAHVFNSTLLCCGQGVKIITQRRVPNILRHKGGSVTEKVPLELGTDLWRRASSMKERRAMSIAVAKPSCNTYYGSGGILSAFTCEFIQVL